MMMDSSSKIISLALLSLLVLASAGPAILRDGEDTKKSCTDNDSSQCDGDWQICCDGECVNLSDGCLGVSGDALWGIGIAAAVASIAIPVICCCCCCGALFWFLRRRSQRQG